jgi:hypothetical protein
MGIGMWVRPEMAERGQRLAEGTVAWYVERGDGGPLSFEDTPLLIGVDPYGDTVFNWIQMTWQIPREIEYLRSKLTDDASVVMLDELARLVAFATEGPSEGAGRYLWFVGD